MNLQQIKVLRTISKIVLLLTGLFLLGYMGYVVYMGVRYKPYKVRVTNVTDSAFTVSWITDTPMPGIVYYGEKDTFLPGPLAWIGKKKAVDDRDSSDAMSECVSKFNKKAAKSKDANFTVDASGFNCNDVKVFKYGKYYTHHITVQNLDAEKEYFFRVGDGVVSYKKSHGGTFVEREMPAISEFKSKTLPVITKVEAPNPAYGTSYNVYYREDGTMGDKKNFDSIIFLKTFKDGMEYITMSSVTNSDGGWTIDLANVRDLEGMVVPMNGVSLEFIPQVDNAKPGASGTTLYEETEFPLRLIGNQIDKQEKVTSGNTFFNITKKGYYTKNILNKMIFSGFTEEECQESSDGTEYCRCTDGKWRVKGTCPSDPVITYKTCWSERCASVSWPTGSECPSNFSLESRPDCSSSGEQTYKCWQLGQDFMCRGVNVGDRTCSGMFLTKEACEAAAPGQRCKDTGNIVKDKNVYRAGCTGYKKTCYYRYYHRPTGETCEYRPAEGENCGNIGCGDDGKRTSIRWGETCTDADGCTCGDTKIQANYKVKCPDSPPPETCGSDWGTWRAVFKNGQLECVEDSFVCIDNQCTSGCYTENACKSNLEPNQTALSRQSNIIIASTDSEYLCELEDGCICQYSQYQVHVNKDSYCATESDGKKDEMLLFDEPNKIGRTCFDSDGCICIYGDVRKEVKMGKQCAVDKNDIRESGEFYGIVSEQNATVCCSQIISSRVSPPAKEYVYKPKSECNGNLQVEGDKSLCNKATLTAIPVNQPNVLGKVQYGCCKGSAIPLSNKCEGGFDTEISETCINTAPKAVYCLPNKIVETGQIINIYETNCPVDTKEVTLNEILSNKSGIAINGIYCCEGGPHGMTLSNTPCNIGKFKSMSDCIKFSQGNMQDSSKRNLTMGFSLKAYANNSVSNGNTNQYFYYPEKGVYDLTLLNNLEKTTIVSNGVSGYIFYYDRNGIPGYQSPTNNASPDKNEDLIMDSSVMISLSKVAVVNEVSFKRGINIISFNFAPFVGGERIFNTNDFFQIANSKGNIISRISYFEGGQWNGGVVYDFETRESIGVPFDLVFGKGYVVVAERDTTIEIPGLEIKESVPVAFSSGWNLVGIHGYSTVYTARTLIESINTIEGLKSDNVTWWPTSRGMYQGYQLINGQSYGQDYPISPLNGYFVRINEFNPKDTSCTSLLWNPGGEHNGVCGK